MKNMSTKTKKLGKLHVCVGSFLVAFILVILHVGWFFGEFAFWLCFSFHLFLSMCCWNQLSLLKLVSQYKGQMNHIGFRVYPTISNHTLPRNVSKGGVSLSPPSFIHFWTFISLGPKLTAKSSLFGLKKIYTRIWLDFVFIQPHPTMCKV